MKNHKSIAVFKVEFAAAVNLMLSLIVGFSLAFNMTWMLKRGWALAGEHQLVVDYICRRCLCLACGGTKPSDMW